jgi:hypothetical protein
MVVRRVPRFVLLAAVVLLPTAVVVVGVRSGRPEPAPPAFHQSSLTGGPPLDEVLGQIRVGQTRDEVESLIGPPRDDYHGTQAAVDQYFYRDKGYKLWIGRVIVLAVLYDEHGVAVDVQKMGSFAVR